RAPRECARPGAISKRLSWSNLREGFHGFAHPFRGVVVVDELTGEVIIVGLQVQEPVAAEVEENGAGLALLLCGECLIDCGTDGVAAFGCGDDASVRAKSVAASKHGVWG